MKISELIAKLSEILQTEGDIEVKSAAYDGQMSLVSVGGLEVVREKCVRVGPDHRPVMEPTEPFVALDT